ncbi:MAG: hypothetical protein AAF682_23160 [Planctomycetota bacterium]
MRPPHNPYSAPQTPDPATPPAAADAPPEAAGGDGEAASAALPSMGEVPKLEVASWQIPLLDVLAAITRHLWMLAALMGLGMFNAYRSIRTAEPFYTASAVAVLLPREKPLIDATVDTGSLETTQDVARRSSTASLTLPPNADLYLTLLKSSSTLEKLAERFAEELRTNEGAKENHRSPEMVAEIRDMVTITGTEDGLLTVSVQSYDPKLAANVCNAILEEGELASKEIERQLVLQQAVFLDQAATSARIGLEQSEAQYRAFVQETGVYDPKNEIAQLVSQTQQLRRAADQLEGEINALLEARTEEDALVIEKRARLKYLRKETEQLEADLRRGEPAADMGTLMLERNAIEQVVRFRRDLVITLTTQADIFRIRAEQPAGSIAIIRRANVPHRPAGPSKKGMAAKSVAGSVFLAGFLILVFEQLALIRRTRELDSRLGQILGNVAQWLPIRLAGTAAGFAAKPVIKPIRSIYERRRRRKAA